MSKTIHARRSTSAPKTACGLAPATPGDVRMWENGSRISSVTCMKCQRSIRRSHREMGEAVNRWDAA